jgi:hypothetical protein
LTCLCQAYLSHAVSLNGPCSIGLSATTIASSFGKVISGEHN